MCLFQLNEALQKLLPESLAINNLKEFYQVCVNYTHKHKNAEISGSFQEEVLMINHCFKLI